MNITSNFDTTLGIHLGEKQYSKFNSVINIIKQENEGYARNIINIFEYILVNNKNYYKHNIVDFFVNSICSDKFNPSNLNFLLSYCTNGFNMYQTLIFKQEDKNLNSLLKDILNESINFKFQYVINNYKYYLALALRIHNYKIIIVDTTDKFDEINICKTKNNSKVMLNKKIKKCHLLLLLELIKYTNTKELNLISSMLNITSFTMCTYLTCIQEINTDKTGNNETIKILSQTSNNNYLNNPVKNIASNLISNKNIIYHFKNKIFNDMVIAMNNIYGIYNKLTRDNDKLKYNLILTIREVLCLFSNIGLKKNVCETLLFCDIESVLSGFFPDKYFNLFTCFVNIALYYEDDNLLNEILRTTAVIANNETIINKNCVMIVITTFWVKLRRNSTHDNIKLLFGIIQKEKKDIMDICTDSIIFIEKKLNLKLDIAKIKLIENIILATEVNRFAYFWLMNKYTMFTGDTYFNLCRDLNVCYDTSFCENDKIITLFKFNLNKFKFNNTVESNPTEMYDLINFILCYYLILGHEEFIKVMYIDTLKSVPSITREIFMHDQCNMVEALLFLNVHYYNDYKTLLHVMLKLLNINNNNGLQFLNCFWNNNICFSNKFSNNFLKVVTFYTVKNNQKTILDDIISEFKCNNTIKRVKNLVKRNDLLDNNTKHLYLKKISSSSDFIINCISTLGFKNTEISISGNADSYFRIFNNHVNAIDTDKNQIHLKVICVMIIYFREKNKHDILNKILFKKYIQNTTKSFNVPIKLNFFQVSVIKNLFEIPYFYDCLKKCINYNDFSEWSIIDCQNKVIKTMLGNNYMPKYNTEFTQGYYKKIVTITNYYKKFSDVINKQNDNVDRMTQLFPDVKSNKKSLIHTIHNIFGNKNTLKKINLFLSRGANIGIYNYSCLLEQLEYKLLNFDINDLRAQLNGQTNCYKEIKLHLAILLAYFDANTRHHKKLFTVHTYKKLLNIYILISEHVTQTNMYTHNNNRIDQDAHRLLNYIVNHIDRHNMDKLITDQILNRMSKIITIPYITQKIFELYNNANNVYKNNVKSEWKNNWYTVLSTNIEYQIENLALM